MSVTTPMARIPAAKFQRVMMASGMAVAKMRTQSAMAQEVVAGVALATGEEQPGGDDGREIQEDDRDVERAHLAKRPAPGAGLHCRSGTDQQAQTVKDDPQPQPPVAFGFSKAKPDSWKLLL